jgi:hypothetical protein
MQHQASSCARRDRRDALFQGQHGGALCAPARDRRTAASRGDPAGSKGGRCIQQINGHMANVENVVSDEIGIPAAPPPARRSRPTTRQARPPPAGLEPLHSDTVLREVGTIVAVSRTPAHYPWHGRKHRAARPQIEGLRLERNIPI